MSESSDVTPEPPCDACPGRCCVAPGRKTLAVVSDAEKKHFPDAVLTQDASGWIWALPVAADGRCLHLDDANRCRIYERRPAACRQFNCLFSYRLAQNRHGFFLSDRPELVQLIEARFPDFVARRAAEQAKRPVL